MERESLVKATQNRGRLLRRERCVLYVTVQYLRCFRVPIFFTIFISKTYVYQYWLLLESHSECITGIWVCYHIPDELRPSWFQSKAFILRYPKKKEKKQKTVYDR